jgi:hypothetical protein
MRWLLYVWAFPTTCLGLFLAVLTLFTRGKCKLVDGVLEVHGGFGAFFLERIVLLEGGASAMTLGHVVLARNGAILQITRQHERVHVRQTERWGPFFIPLYLTFSLIAFLRGKDSYRDNPFEREAFDHAG